MITLTLQFETIEEMVEALGNGPVFRKYDIDLGGSASKLAAAEEGEVVGLPRTAQEVVTPVEEPTVKPKAAKKAPPKKAATKGTAQKKNEAQARAAAKAKQQEQEAEGTVQEGDLTALTGETPAPAAVTVTKADVDKALRAYASQYQLTGARALLAKFGVQVASALQESQYAAFVAAAQQPPAEA